MLSRALQAAALIERILRDSLTQSLSNETGRLFLVNTLPRIRSSNFAQCWVRPTFSSVAAAPTDAAPDLRIHPSAAARLRELQSERPPGTPSLALRVEVEGGGCSGFQYKFNLEETERTKKEDIVFETDGGRVVCDAISLEFLRGATLEFEDTIMRAAFSISKNPNAEASCGCGSSFAAKMK